MGILDAVFGGAGYSGFFDNDEQAAARARAKRGGMVSPYGGSSELEGYQHPTTSAIPESRAAAASGVTDSPRPMQVLQQSGAAQYGGMPTTPQVGPGGVIPDRPYAPMVGAGTGAPSPQAPRATRTSVGGGGAVGVQPVQSGFTNRMAMYDQDIAGLRKQLTDANAPADYTAIQEQVRNRARGGLDLARAAIAAGMGPQDMQGLQSHLYKQAEAAMAPHKIEGGHIDSSGNLVIDPGFQREKRIAQLRDDLRDAIKNQDSLAAREAQQELVRLQFEANRDARAAAAQQRADELQFKREQAGRERWKHVTDPVSGEVYLYDSGAADPSATLKRAGGGPGDRERPDILPKVATAEHKNAYGNAAMGMERGARLLATLEDEKLAKSFGLAPGAASQIQAVSGIPLADWTQKPEQQQLRAQIMNDAYQAIHALAGAALSAGEASRIMQFAPGPRDSITSIRAKLNAAMEIGKTNRSTLRRMYGMPEHEQFGAPPVVPTAAGGDNASDEKTFMRKPGGTR